VPEDIILRLKNAGDPKAEGVSLCTEQIKFIRENIKGLSGFHIMAISWEEVVPDIINGAGLYPRQ
jgi:methylenetetrahydrofolate reductase (NADPH)